MELELKRAELHGFEELSDTMSFCEETMECIVPDACPDIRRVLDTRGTVCLTGREIREGKVEIRGTVRVDVIYIPDGEEGVRRIEVGLPFVCVQEIPGVHPGCILSVEPRLLGADARMLNPRKLYVRTEAAVIIQVFDPMTGVCSTGCECGGEWGVEQRLETFERSVVAAVEEKPFSFSDDLTLPGSKPELRRLLHQDVELVCSESRVIGSRLIFKGQAMLHILYEAGDGSLVTAQFELPFSQIMEVSNAGENASCHVSVVLTDLSCQTDEEDSRLLSISMGMLAQAVLREDRKVELLTDLYSTRFETRLEERGETLRVLREEGTRRESVREVLECAAGVRSVVDCRLALGEITRSWEGDRLTLSADARITLIYHGEDEELCSMTRAVPAVCRMEVTPGCIYTCRCTCPGELYATPTAGGIEVRFPLDFTCRSQETYTVKQIVAAQLDRDAPVEVAGRPSVVLHRILAGETLWELAKKHRTTTRCLLEANAVEEEMLPEGKLLLIPDRR